MFYNRQQLETAVGRRLAKHSASRLLSFFSGSLLLNQKNPKNPPSRFLDSLLEAVLKNREKITDERWKCKLRRNKVTCRVRYRVWIRVIPTRGEFKLDWGWDEWWPARSIIDFSAINDRVARQSAIFLIIPLVKYAATVNYPEGEEEVDLARQQITPLNR